MRSDMLLLIAARFDRALFVGDPGQLDPFSIIETPRWIGLPYDPMQNAVTVLQAHNPDLPVHRLPVSWRLPASAAPVDLQRLLPVLRLPRRHRRRHPAPGVHRRRDTQQRRRHPGRWPHDPAGHCTNCPRGTRSAPTARQPRQPPRLAARLLARGAVGTCERHPGGRRSARRTSRSASPTATRPTRSARPSHRPHPPAAGMIRVDTANRLQGAEFDVTIVLHPLSGRRDATAFHLEAGRLCVLASRHRHACIVVARAGIADLLDAHPSDEPVHLGVRAKFPDGWEANHALLAHLAHHRIPA